MRRVRRAQKWAAPVAVRAERVAATKRHPVAVEVVPVRRVQVLVVALVDRLHP